MRKSDKYSDEVRERAVWMVLERQALGIKTPAEVYQLAA